MSNREEFIKNIGIENIPIEEEEASHPTGRAMIIYGLIQGNIVLAYPLMVTATIITLVSRLEGLKLMFWLTR